MPKKPGARKKRTGSRGAASGAKTVKPSLPASKKAATKRTGSISATDMQRLLKERTEELRLHQLELEMQNEELRCAQQLLEASRAKYADLYDLAPVGYFSFRAKGLISEVNLSGARLLGHEKQALILKPFLLFIHPDDRMIFEEHERAVVANGTRQACELRLLRRDGSFFFSRLESIADGQTGTAAAPGILTAVIDVNDRKEADEALRRSEERFRISLQTAPISVATLDRELRYTWVYNTRHGFRPEQVLGKRADELLPSGDAAQTIALQQEALSKKATIRREIRGKTGDQSWVYDAVAKPVSTDKGEVVGLTFVALDITERKQAEEALQRSEERFRVAQDLSLDAFTILTAVRDKNGAIEDFRWEYANQTAGRYLGHVPADLVGRRLLQVLPGNKTGSDLFTRYAHVVETGKSHDYELAYESDGISGWFRNMAVKLGDGIAVYFSDISERKHAELELQQRAEEYRTLAENSPDFIARHDRQYRHIYVNRRIADFEGRDQQEFVGKTLEEIGFPAQIAEDFNRIFQRVFESGKEEAAEIIMPGAGGAFTIHRKLVPEFAPDGSVHTVLAIGRDITELKRAENALRKERDKAQQYLDIAGTLIVAIERDGTVSLINQKGCSLLGYPEEEILGRNWFDHFLPEDGREAVRQFFKDIVTGRKATAERHENPVLHRDGTLRLIAWHNSFVRDESGAITGVLCSGEDITERRRVETAFQESEERNRNVLNFTPLGMLLIHDNRIAWVNPAAVRLFGAWNEHDLLGSSPSDLFPASHHYTIERHIEDLKRGGLPVETIEVKIMTLDRSVRVVEVTTVPFVNAQESSILMMLNDVTRRKQTETALQQNEARLRAFFEKAGDAIFVLEAEGEFAGHILTANQAAADMHGYTVPELKAMSIKDIDSPGDADQVPDRIRRMMAGEWLKCEITHRRKDGSIFPLEISTGLVVSGDQKFILGFDRDITERKKAEKALRESREQYHHLFNAVSDGIVLHAFNGETHFGRFVTANETLCRMLGYTEEELLGLSPRDIVLEEVEGALREWDIIRMQGSFVHNKTLLTRSGERIPVEISSRMFEHNGAQMALSVIRDVTERRKTDDLIRRLNQDLRRRVSELETIFNTAPIGLAIAQDHEARQVRGNAAHLRALGVSEEGGLYDQAPEFLVQMFQDERQLSVDELPLKRAVRGEVITGQIIDVKRPDGQTVKLHCSVAPLLDEQGKPCGAVGAFLDITGLIRAEDEISKLNSNLHQNVHDLRIANNELEAFIYSVSHDLRAPLRSIRGFSEFLLHDYHASLDDRGKGYLDRVVRNTARMDQLIDDLLHLSRISRQQLDRADIDVSRVMHELAGELKNAHPERQVDITIQEGLVARADPRLIRIALANLLNNAWKFTLKTEAPRIEFGSEKKDGTNSYFLRDNGAGFDQNYADKLFLPFHRLHTEQEFEGSGIGLAIVDRVIRRHSGRIWAEGKPDAGAVFYFTLHD